MARGTPCLPGGWRSRWQRVMVTQGLCLRGTRVWRFEHGDAVGHGFHTKSKTKGLGVQTV